MHNIKNIIINCLIIALIIGVTFFYKTQQKLAQLPQVIAPGVINPPPGVAQLRARVFQTGELCSGQDAEIAECNKRHGNWSCASKFCFNNTTEMSVLYSYITEPFEKFVLDIGNLNKFLAPYQGEECIGKKEDRATCAERGLRWNCKMAVCMSLKSYLAIQNNIQELCASNKTCIEDFSKKFRQYYCSNQFNNESCLLAQSDYGKYTDCLKSTSYRRTAIDIKWSTKFNGCWKTNYLDYLNGIVLCIEKKTHKSIFSTIDLCVNDLDVETQKLFSSP
jgi:hypothetical protein